jgi:hypothetical protein
LRGWGRPEGLRYEARPEGLRDEARPEGLRDEAGAGLKACATRPDTSRNALMNKLRLAAIGLGVLLVVLGLGFAWGASGRYTAEHALDDTKQQLDLAEARARILEARVSLYNVNFGDAQRQFEDAKAPLTRARDRYQQDGKRDAAEGLAAALARVQEAQRLAGRLDQNANTQANEALKAIQVATSK